MAKKLSNFNYGRVVGGDEHAIWNGLVLLHGQSVMPARLSSIVAKCKTVRFMVNDIEYKKTKLLVFQHVLDRFGKAEI